MQTLKVPQCYPDIRHLANPLLTHHISFFWEHIFASPD